MVATPRGPTAPLQPPQVGIRGSVGPALRVSSSLRRYYDGIKNRRGAHDAQVCTARKLAELAWTVWTERRCDADRLLRLPEKAAS